MDKVENVGSQRNDVHDSGVSLMMYYYVLITGPPTCLSLAFQGSVVEGARLSFIASYSGGYGFNAI